MEDLAIYGTVNSKSLVCNQKSSADELWYNVPECHKINQLMR